MTEIAKLTNIDLTPLNTKKENAQVLEITDFKKEMRHCIELDEELNRYFDFLSNLSRSELLTIVKYEVYNRVLIQQDLDLEKK